jgi:hypothetical protein
VRQSLPYGLPDGSHSCDQHRSQQYIPGHQPLLVPLELLPIAASTEILAEEERKVDSMVGSEGGEGRDEGEEGDAVCWDEDDYEEVVGKEQD